MVEEIYTTKRRKISAKFLGRINLLPKIFLQKTEVLLVLIQNVFQIVKVHFLFLINIMIFTVS